MQISIYIDLSPSVCGLLLFMTQMSSNCYQLLLCSHHFGDNILALLSTQLQYDCFEKQSHSPIIPVNDLGKFTPQSQHLWFLSSPRLQFYKCSTCVQAQHCLEMCPCVWTLLPYIHYGTSTVHT